MPFPIRTLLTGKPNPVWIDPQATAASAMDLMADLDYSQLPVIRDEKVMGVVTSESILHAIQMFQLYPDKFTVKDCLVKVPEYGPDDELFEVLRGLEEIAAVLVINPGGQIIGIVTDYDASVYFHQRSKDIMLLEEIEADLKKMILLAFPTDSSDTNRESLSRAISVASAPIRDREQFKNAVCDYLKGVGGPLPTDEEALNKAYALLSGYSLKPKKFEDLTLKEYILMLLSSDRWATYASVITMDKGGINKMLTEVAEIRNKVAHFRGDVSRKERRALERCRDWMSTNLRELSQSPGSGQKSIEEVVQTLSIDQSNEAPETDANLDKSEENLPALLYCRAKGLSATGYLDGEKLVVKAGSEVTLEAAPSLIKHVRSIVDLRIKLISDHVIRQDDDRLVFAKDYEFSSPSTAAAVVLGRSANGLVEWKTKSGQTLKGLRENAK